MKAKILLIEGKRTEHASFVTGLIKKGFQVETVANGAAALTRLAEDRPHLVLVDAASMRTSGRRICQSIRQQVPGLPITLVLAAKMPEQDKFEADVVLVQPFTLQKLLNRIRPLLPVEPRDVLTAGPLQLDLEQRMARLDNRQARLTPRLVVLLRTLMEHPGEVIERKALFSQVWDTNYTEDTRTLDVHMSWLREAIEDDPRHPVYIKTVRGVGYRLDLGDDR
jgi:DNA-binding response OmpR family regulator